MNARAAATCGLLLGLSSCAHLAHAQAAHGPQASEELRLIESTERDLDPLGLDESTGRGLDTAARTLPKKEVVLPRAVAGEALSAIEAVHETRFALEVRFEQGLAFATVRASFASNAPYPAELAYRLALPVGAVPSEVAVCSGGRCRAAPPRFSDEAQTEGSPWLEAHAIHDARGEALAVRMGPITKGAELELAVSWVVAAPVRGGHARLRLPARGYDPRLAVSDVHVESGYEGVAPEDAQVEPMRERELVVELGTTARGRTATTRSACGKQACVRRFEAAPSAPLSARPVWLWLDASPSMEGPARGRADAVLAALLTLLPEQTELHAWAFAGQAREIGAFKAGEAPLSSLSDALVEELGNATRLASVVKLSAAQLARSQPRVVVISDGRFEQTKTEQHALEQATRLGAELWLVALGDDPPRVSQPFAQSGGVLEVQALSDRVLAGDGLTALAEGLRAIASPRRADGLRAGEQRVVESAPRELQLGTAPSWLTLWMARDSGPLRFVVGRADTAAIAAPPYDDAPSQPPAAATAMPAESVLAMLRTQLVPRARACLRSDRKGRGDYQVALTFRALFARREVSEAVIEGDIPQPLRECLSEVLPSLRVPAFSGAVRVRYPIHTEREPPPPVIELEPDVARQIERVIRPAGWR